MFILSHGSSQVKFSLWPFCGWILGPTCTKAIWVRFDLQRKQWVRYFASRTGWLNTYKNYKIRMVGRPFRRSIEITQNATRAAKRKSQAIKSGSNQTVDTQLAVHVRGKNGEKYLIVIYA